MNFCPHCGKGIEIGNIFCPHCGNKIDSPTIDPANDPIAEEEWRTFIARHADYYQYKFRNFLDRGTNSFAITWNWPAFFLGFIWMLYRKMYLWALIAFIIAFTPVAFPLTMIGWGIVGNYLYFLHVRNKIIEYKSRQSQTSMALSLAELGGVNRWVLFAGFVFFLFLLAIVFLGFQLIFHFLEYAGVINPEFIEV
jgi:hypothetical protein